MTGTNGTIDPALAELSELVGARRPRDGAPLPETVQWLEKVTAVGARALKGDAAAAAITDLRAALGAVVQWGRGPRTPEKLVELELVMRALVMRGSVGLLQAVAVQLRTLAREGIQQQDCLTAATAYEEAAAAVRDGGVIRASTFEAMRTVATVAARR